ncbi:DUF4625 domain-containing protein [Chitinophaga horti]|uniref:DUF4625 domain-containing protein n=1 Tax=Chitinophaga horti TaxID=2920382 RepID=A0ABY6IYW0_9BACT|nr:DUF4625 domain-containing protein [Chitinophaga horti]UYQ91194.1 DUF4625 domain-containing protein [Chitinophaga horti]
MKKHILLPLLAAGLLASCSKDKDDTDTTYPEIGLNIANAFPTQCGTVKRGEAFTFRALLTDNRELGSVSVDVHHNFDQHSHSTEVVNCENDPKKAAVNPFVFINSYTIPAGLKEYQPEVSINVPADVDPGDYHFLVRVTDKAGWQTIRGISIKII